MIDLDQVDPNFRADLLESDNSVLAVARKYVREDWEVFVPELEIRPDPGLRRQYRDAGDLFVRCPPGKAWLRVEVKVAKSWTSGSWPAPWRTTIVGNTYKWDHGLPIWAFYVLRADYGRAIVFYSTARPYFEARENHAGGRRQVAYYAPTELAEELVL